MGLFKSIKQAKDAVAEAPGLMQDAMEMQKAAQAQAEAQREQLAAAAAANPTAAAAAAEGGTAPIAGVSLALYAQISKTLADRGGDQSTAPSIAAEHGVDGDAWEAAVAGWNQRMADDSSVGAQFSALYRDA